MTDNTRTFEEQYQDALRALEDDSTDIFIVAAAAADGDHSAVFGANENADLEIDHIGLLAAACVHFADATGQPVGDVIGDVVNRMVHK